ncbi:cytochrome P450 [Nonomuraea sp. NPDC050536]|uniref:cytochrome P450 n=1 Tax=Nonomuraea sp. NPDC050536 TaxID=3364366 RepID=UPI0037C9FA08
MDIDYNPFAFRLQADPYPIYAQLLEHAPLYRSVEHDFYALTRHGDVAAAFRDSTTFSSAYGVQLDGWRPNAAARSSFLAMDPPDHTRMRGLVAAAFTSARVAGMEPAIRAFVRRHLDDVLQGGALTWDFAKWVAVIPVHVVSELLGIPEADRGLMLQLTEVLVARQDGVSTERPPGYYEAIMAALQYYTELIVERRARPADDLTSALIQARTADGEQLTTDEIASAMLLLGVAGNETTARLLGLCWYQAWRHPNQRAIAWSGAITGWLGETLRHSGPVQTVARRATRDIEMHGQHVPAGSRMLLVVAAANRDPHVFPNPDRYDVARDTTATLAFGQGRHFCLGAALARLQAQIVLEELVASIASYEIEVDSAKRLGSPTLRGYIELPTTVKVR